MSQISLIEQQGPFKIIGVRIIKMVNGQESGFHRATIAPGQDAKTVMQAVNADLIRMGFDPVDGNPVSAMVDSIHTPAVIANYKTAIADAEAADAAAAEITPAKPAGNLTIVAEPPVCSIGFIVRRSETVRSILGCSPISTGDAGKFSFRSARRRSGRRLIIFFIRQTILM